MLKVKEPVMGNVKRIYVEKKEDYAVKAKEVLRDLRSYLGLKNVEKVRVFIRYDVENLAEDVFEESLCKVFSEPPVDDLYKETLDVPANARLFSVEYLPGQYDQRADSAVQCVQFLSPSAKPVIKTAVTYMIIGEISDEEFDKIKAYCINPVDSRESGTKKPDTLITKFDVPEDVKILDGFNSMPEADFRALYDSMGLAMTYKDFLFIREHYSKNEHRDPSFTEIKVLDTYWSDHCRHTTFSTELKNITIDEGLYHDLFEETYEDYLKTREDVYGEKIDSKHVCLMDIALMAMKKIKKDGLLEDMEKSDEINACSIVVPIDVKYEDGKTVTEEWLINFKNETHNHPTEIEPFGGAATCLGGAIRDPLSGRTYVYQAMRVTGAADPTVPADKTLEGKLSQKRLVRGAAAGYSSYGNQIGLATGFVREIYHPDYVAKRMEIGAVMGAAPRRAVIRETSDPGDVIVLLGGRTGRDGCGGATGSSKVHTVSSIETCGAEVQKGNPPTERKIQRLFRREEVSKLIKKCNDFGAGGVSVAIGELAAGLRVNLDLVPKKYEGLDGTELSISESQERMAVVLDPKDVDEFLGYAAEENLEAVKVAEVTEDPRLVLVWRGKEIVNIARSFLDTNGAHQETDVRLEMPSKDSYLNEFATPEVEAALKAGDIKKAVIESVSDLNTCSQKGLVEMFDSSIGAGSVVMPYGGKYQMTPVQTMIAKVPVQKGTSDAVTMMSYGFDPYISSWSPYHGAAYAVIESMSKIVAAGGDYKKIRFTFQEYFRRMTEEATRWSQPFAALLGAYSAQMAFKLPSIGGKDSMSGTFQDIDVPPTLCSFAVDVAKVSDVITDELKAAGNKLVIFKVARDKNLMPDYEALKKMYDNISSLMKDGKVLSAYVIDSYGIVPALAKMAMGNGLGFKTEAGIDAKALFANEIGSIILEVKPENVVVTTNAGAELIGEVTDKDVVIGDVTVSSDDVRKAYVEKLDRIFPSRVTEDYTKIDEPLYEAKEIYVCKNKVAKPRVFIPVFPGTNCEYDSGNAFTRAGAEVETIVFKNMSEEDIKDSINAYAKAIKNAQIIMFPGGFSAGDEPDGSAKFFATAFQNEIIKEAVMDLLNNRDGLALGICNGFQALIKLGLVPWGEIVGQKEDSPTLTFNTINRHISKMAYTKVVSNKSPWLQGAEVGKVYTSPASHGEGRFVAPKETIEKLFKNGQVATQYSDFEGNVSMDEEWNINGSYASIEGITSPDGRVFGKMAHAERRGDGVAINIYGEQDLKIFESGVKYFK